MTVKKVKKLNVSAPKKDTQPNWTGHESWNTDQFLKNFREAMSYYNLNHSGKDLKPQVINWMGRNNYSKKQIQSFKDTKDWRSHLTMGAIASCLIRGMPEQRDDFNNGKNTAQWLRLEIEKVIKEGTYDVAKELKATKPQGPIITIQDRVRDAGLAMTEEIETAIETWHNDPNNFEPKEFKIISILKGKEAKAAHARVIKDFYNRQLTELQELAGAKPDPQLVEGYSHRSKKQIRKLMEFLQEIDSACNMLMQEAKVTRKPRKIKSISKDKLISKLKYKKTDDALKLVSINPTDIIGSKELWVYNIKTRKLGKYIADEYRELSVKGTSVINFNESLSIQKTLRKPVDQIKAFKSAGKVQLRKFLDEINAVDTKLNGRLSDDIILLKAG